MNFFHCKDPYFSHRQKNQLFLLFNVAALKNLYSRAIQNEKNKIEKMKNSIHDCAEVAKMFCIRKNVWANQSKRSTFSSKQLGVWKNRIRISGIFNSNKILHCINGRLDISVVVCYVLLNKATKWRKVRVIALLDSQRLIKNRLTSKSGSVNFHYLEHLIVLAINQIADTLLSKSGFDFLCYCLVF